MSCMASSMTCHGDMESPSTRGDLVVHQVEFRVTDDFDLVDFRNLFTNEFKD